MDTINSSNLSGRVAFICQRRDMNGFIRDLAIRESISFSHFINLDSDSTENLDLSEIIDKLGAMHTVESILIYIENIQNIRKFMSSARSVSRVKPIIVLKSRRTGNFAYRDSLYDAAFKRAGVLRVNDFEEMFDCAKFISIRKSPKVSKLTIITNSDGIGTMAVDALGSYGMKPSEFNNGNPVVIPDNATFTEYLDNIRTCIEAPETDSLLIIYTQSDPVNSSTTYLHDESSINSLAQYLKTVKIPVFTACTNRQTFQDIFSKYEIISYNTPERGVRAFANLCQYTRNIEMLQQIPVRKDKRLLINRKDAQSVIDSALEQVNQLELLQKEHIGNSNKVHNEPVHIVLNELETKKLVEAYGIYLNLKESDSDIPKVDYELMMSASLDSAFGPVICFGIGGVMTDIVEDIATGLPPLDSLLAHRLMEESRISKVFKGYFHIKPLNCELVEDILIRLSRLVTDFPEIKEIQINPIIVKGGTPNITRVKAVIKKSDFKPPMQLVISSYPFEYESEDETIEHEKIFIRPIRPSDAPLMVEHFSSLSPKSVYYRFFTPLKILSQSMLIRLTQIDYDREIALVALMGDGDDQIMVGVARVIFEHNCKKGEFSIVLGDKWHGKGIGAALLKRCLSFAAKKGLETVWGVVLSENRQMLKLAKKLGFNAKYMSGSSECEIEIDLKKVNF